MKVKIKSERTIASEKGQSKEALGKFFFLFSCEFVSYHLLTKPTEGKGVSCSIKLSDWKT